MPRPQFNFGIEVCPLIKHGQLPLQDTDNNLSRTQTVYTIAQCHKPLQDSDTMQNYAKLSKTVRNYSFIHVQKNCCAYNKKGYLLG